MSEMDMPLQRPKTPPPPSYLLTPPTTGGFSKRVHFADLHVAINTTRLTKFVEGESSDAFFEDPQEGSDIELSPSGNSDTTSLNPSPTHSSSSPTRPLRSPSPPSTEPFRFLGLPLSIRNNIYKHLLVIPALICVRQNHTSFHDEKKAFLYAERRELLPGIAYALAQLTVHGYKARFSRFACTNIAILRASKEIYAEARAILYGGNAFEIAKSSNEMAPAPNFAVRLFPTGCQRLLTRLHIRIRSFYDLYWLLRGGYNVVKHHYRGLLTLILILELESASKGFGRKWARGEGEKWTAYVLRLRAEIAHDLFSTSKCNKASTVPLWMDLRVLFAGESYVAGLGVLAGVTDCEAAELRKREELKAALVEAWELFKKGG